jgi:hypothetical protein
VSALSDEDIKCPYPAPVQESRSDWKELIGVVISCFVRNDRKDTFSGLNKI